VRYLAAAALLLGCSATAACSDDAARPTVPSPGLNNELPATGTPSAGSEPARTTPGIDLSVVPRPDGSLDVTENVLLLAATGMLPLQLPTSGEHLPGLMTPTTPRVTNLKVFADDRPVPLESTTVAGADFVPLTVATSRIRLTYRLSGSTVLASPSTSTRAGAAVRPLTAGAEATLPTDVKVSGALLNAVCPLLTETRCAVGDPPRLSIRPGIPANQALIVLQLDLPR
jgi:hypothetical protein